MDQIAINEKLTKLEQLETMISIANQRFGTDLTLLQIFQSMVGTIGDSNSGECVKYIDCGACIYCKNPSNNKQDLEKQLTMVNTEEGESVCQLHFPNV